MTTTTQTQIGYMLRMDDTQLARLIDSLHHMLGTDSLPGILVRAEAMLDAALAEQARRAS